MLISSWGYIHVNENSHSELGCLMFDVGLGRDNVNV